MAEIFIDGFDKYGPVGVTSLEPYITGEWNLALVGYGGFFQIGKGLSSSGFSVNLNGGETITSISKTLYSNMPRIIGGVRINVDLIGSHPAIMSGVSFVDANTLQCEIMIQPGTGFIQFIRYSGATSHIVNTSSVSVRAHSSHYLEWDISIGGAGAYSIYLDSILILNGNAATNGGSGNNYINQFQLKARGAAGYQSQNTFYDDLYIFDTTGPYNNAVLRSNPRIETQLPINDIQKQFVNNGTYLGNITPGGSGVAVSSNKLILTKKIPSVDMTIDTIVLSSGTTYGVDEFRAVLYSDLSGSPNSLLAQSNIITGVSSTLFEFNLITSHNLIGGNPYWLGAMYKTNVIINGSQSVTVNVDNAISNAVIASYNFDSGAPAIAPSVISGQSSWLLYGICSNVSTNWITQSNNPGLGDQSSISANIPGTEDLYGFPAITNNPTSIYTVGVKSLAKLTDTGNRTVDLRIKSNSVTNSGTITNQVLTTSYGWIDSYFPVDPGTGNIWSESTINGSVSGIKLVS